MRLEEMSHGRIPPSSHRSGQVHDNQSVESYSNRGQYSTVLAKRGHSLTLLEMAATRVTSLTLETALSLLPPQIAYHNIFGLLCHARQKGVKLSRCDTSALDWPSIVMEHTVQ